MLSSITPAPLTRWKWKIRSVFFLALQFGGQERGPLGVALTPQPCVLTTCPSRHIECFPPPFSFLFLLPLPLLLEGMDEVGSYVMPAMGSMYVGVEDDDDDDDEDVNANAISDRASASALAAYIERCTKHDWNDRFQEMLLHRDTKKRALRDLSRSFAQAAQAVCVRITEELYATKKTIEPIATTGIAGGVKYLQEGSRTSCCLVVLALPCLLYSSFASCQVYL